MAQRWFLDNTDSTSNHYVVVETGLPIDCVNIGLGTSPEQALETLEATPIQSLGRDSGVAQAIRWAQGQGWITSEVPVAIDDPTEEEECEDDDYEEDFPMHMGSEEDYS